MAEHADPGNKDAEQVRDEAWRAFRMVAEGCTLRQAATVLGISYETVRRRLASIEHVPPPHEQLRAMQNERLNVAVERLINLFGAHDVEPADVAKLAHAVVQVERRRSQLWGLDEPTRKAVEISASKPQIDFDRSLVGRWVAEHENELPND